MRTGDLLEIGKWGLLASQSGLAVTSSNIANANNPDYSRRDIILSLSGPLSGASGSGSGVADVRRAYSEYVNREVMSQRQHLSRAATEKGLLQQVEQLFNSSAGFGLDASLDGFFSAWNSLAANPQGYAERTAVIAKAGAFVGAARRMDGMLNQIVGQINRAIGTAVEQVNAVTGQIASLNRQIMSAQAGSTVEAAPDLRDRRDGLLRELAALTDFSYYEDRGTGAVTVITGARMLVSGVEVRKMTVGTNGDGMASVLVGGNEVTGVISRGELGGLLAGRASAMEALGGLSRVVAAVVNETNIVHASGFGLDALEKPPVEGDFWSGSFSPAANAGSISSVSINTSEFAAGLFVPGEYRIVFTGSTSYAVYKGSEAAPLVENAAYNPITKSISIHGADVIFSADPAAGDQYYINTTRKDGQFFNDLRVLVKPMQSSAVQVNTTTVPPSVISRLALTYDEYEIRFADSGTFSIFNVSKEPPRALSGATGTVWDYTDGVPIEFDGLRVVLHGTAQAGDRFLVSPVRFSAGSNLAVAVTDTDRVVAAATLRGLPGDNSNAYAAYRLRRSAEVFAGNARTIEEFYQSVVSDVALRAGNATDAEKFEKNLLAEITNRRDALSGVSLEEEAVKLIMFQRSFEAAARIINVTDKMLETIISLR